MNGRKPLGLLSLVVALVLVGGGLVLGRILLMRDDGSPPVPRSAAPASSASPSPSPSPPPRGSLLIHGAGDTNLDPNYISTFQSEGFGFAWTGLNGLFQRDDLTVVNLECAVTDGGTLVPKEFNFRGDPDGLPAMKAAGVEVASMANNHSYDFGPEGLLDTRRNVLAAGIRPVGAGPNETEAERPAIFTMKGWKIAVIGVDEVLDPLDAVAGPNKAGTAVGHAFDRALNAVKVAARLATIVIVNIHWGVELDTVPRDYQVDEAHRMIDAGADIIFGGHSHRLQPMETYAGRPIFYSLGNFVWPNFSSAGATTAVAEVTVGPRERYKGRLIPAFIEFPGHPVLTGA